MRLPRAVGGEFWAAAAERLACDAVTEVEPRPGGQASAVFFFAAVIGLARACIGRERPTKRSRAIRSRPTWASHSSPQRLCRLRPTDRIVDRDELICNKHWRSWGTLPVPNVDLGNGLLLVVAAAAAQITCPGYDAHLWNRRLISTRPWKHVADLGYFAFRLLHRRVLLRTKEFACGVLYGSGVRTKQLLCIRVAIRDELAVA